MVDAVKCAINSSVLIVIICSLDDFLSLECDFFPSWLILTSPMAWILWSEVSLFVVDVVVGSKKAVYGNRFSTCARLGEICGYKNTKWMPVVSSVSFSHFLNVCFFSCPYSFLIRILLVGSLLSKLLLILRFKICQTNSVDNIVED